MPAPFDYKKTYKDLYLPKKPLIIDVPAMLFIHVDGKGNPNTCEAYKYALELVYGLSYAIRMSKKQGTVPQGYFEYVVPPLEGLWWAEGNDACMSPLDKDTWNWTAMIRQPEFVDEEVFATAKQVLTKKKPHLDLSLARCGTFTEGLCAQIMHTGSYDDEALSLEILKTYIEANGYCDATSQIRKHHEIYLNDPRKVTSEKLKTVLRHPISKA